MRAKLVNESLENSIPLSQVTWDDINPENNVGVLKLNKWASVKLPKDFMTSREISKERQFDEWLKQFTTNWGTEGELIKVSSDRWDIKGNEKWDNAFKQGAKSLHKFYGSNRGTGNFIGD